VTAAASPIKAVAFASPTRAVAAGAGGVTVVSDDAGATWRRVGASIGSDLTKVVARPGGFGYGVGPATIAVSSNGGESWATFGIPTPLPIHVASFFDPLTGYAQDTGGTLRRTTNGGASWQVLDPGPALGLFQDIVPLRGGRVLLITARGVARSTDGGESFALVRHPTLRNNRIIRGRLLGTASGGSRVFLLGRRGILRSTDGGRSWQRLKLPRVARRAPTIAAGDCAAPSTCWIVTTGARMYRTTNFGRGWSDLTRPVGVPLKAVARVAAGARGEAFLALAQAPSPGEQGVVHHTSDGGRTWAPQVVEAQALGWIDAVPGRAWGLARTTRVLTTTTGGSTGTPSVLSIRASKRVILKPTVVTVTGRLAGATGGEQVALYARGFPARILTVSSGGSFTSLYRLRRTTTFVAQWAGDGVRDGDGTPVLKVRRR